MFWVAGGFEFGLECEPLGPVEVALEDGVLDAGAPVLAEFGDLAEAFAAFGGGGDIVADEHEHGLFDEVGWVGVEVAAEVSGKEKGLDVGKDAEGGAFVEEWVDDGVLFLFLPGLQDAFAGGVFEGDDASLGNGEVVGAELAEVDE